MKTNLLLITLATLFCFTSCKEKKQLPAPAEIQKIAEEAYAFGIPFVLEYETMYMQAIDKNSPSYVGFGKFLHYGAATSDSKDVMTPNRDTPYSWLWLDLRTEPWVLTVPPMDAKEKRYYAFQLNDLAGFVVDNVSALNDGYDGGSYLITSPTWKGETPAGIKRVIKGETDFIGALIRTQLLGDKDVDKVKSIQESYKVEPMSSFLGTEAPAPAPAIDFYKFEDGKTENDISFFSCLSFLLQFNHPDAADKPILDKLASIGIAPNSDFSKLTKENVELADAVTLGIKQMKDSLDYIGKQPLVKDEKNIQYFDSREVMKTDYMSRAIGAYLGLFGNTQKEAVYNNLGSDTDGVPLDGSKYSYTLTYAKGNIPDVRFFWSVTMYSGIDRFLVDNPINRYSIGSSTEGLKYNKDGSLTIYIQKDKPTKDKESNWLPAPNGPFYSIMRLYGPGKNVMDNTYKQPQMVKVKK